MNDLAIGHDELERERERDFFFFLLLQDKMLDYLFRETFHHMRSLREVRKFRWLYILSFFIFSWRVRERKDFFHYIRSLCEEIKFRWIVYFEFFSFFFFLGGSANQWIFNNWKVKMSFLGKKLWAGHLMISIQF